MIQRYTYISFGNTLFFIVSVSLVIFFQPVRSVNFILYIYHVCTCLVEMYVVMQIAALYSRSVFVQFSFCFFLFRNILFWIKHF